MKRLLLAALLLFPASAWAACSITSVTMLDAVGSPQTFCVGGVSGSLLNQNQVVGSTPANILAIDSSGRITVPSGAALDSSLAAINTTLGLPMQTTGGTVGGDGVAGTASANVMSVQGIASMTPIAVTVSASVLPTGAATSALQSTINTTLGSPIQTTGGTVGVVAGTALIGKVGIDQTTLGTTNGVSIVAAPGGGAGSYHVIAAASDNHANIKNGAGQVYSIQASSGSADYIRLYNAASGFNGCNSATGIIWGLQIPSNTNNSGFVVQFPTGKAFSTGISICITGGGAVDNDTTAGHTTTVLNLGYQ